MRLVHLWTAVILAAFPAPADGQVAQANDWRPTLSEQVESELPDWDYSDLTGAEAEPFWTAAVDVELVSHATDVTIPDDYSIEETTHIYRNENNTIKISKDEASIRFFSAERSFSPGNTTHIPVDEMTAVDLVLAAASVLGLPEDEFSGQSVDRIVVSIFDIGQPGLPPSTHTVGTMVSVYRQINGLKVAGSIVRGTVTNDGDIGRLRIRWPDFFLICAEQATPRSRDEIVEEIVEHVQIDTGDAAPSLFYELVYFPTDTGGNIGFFPGLQVQILPAEGTPSVIVVPLVE